ncbi:hypothetical protein [Thermus altitudinis]|uniref:hypothetical protein n=1 Tax=Thermus altitudinis TaxID=2908145 RepID=UPI00242ECA52|nr:hypothetical protein [Thermus altitudinis]
MKALEVQGLAQIHGDGVKLCPHRVHEDHRQTTGKRHLLRQLETLGDGKGHPQSRVLVHLPASPGHPRTPARRLGEPG